MRIKVKVKPGAGRNEVKKLSPDSFEIKVTVPPEKGKANEKVIELIAKYFNKPKSCVNIIKGETFRQKVIEIL